MSILNQNLQILHGSTSGGPPDDDEKEEDDNEVEDNDKVEDNNKDDNTDKGISPLRLNRDLVFSRGHQTKPNIDLHLPQE